MKKLIVILIGVFTTINIWGAKAFSEPLTITQKDGKQLTFMMNGDEHFNYLTTTDGVLLYRDGKDFFVAVIDNDGTLKSSGVLAHNAGQRTTEEITFIGKQDKDKFFKTAEQTTEQTTVPRKGMKKLSMPNDDYTYYPKTLFPHRGNGEDSPKALVILADFADQKFKRYVESDEENDQITMQIFDQYLNAMGARPYHKKDNTLQKNIGSVKQYFSDMSGGKFTPVFDVATVVHLPQNMSVYGENWTANNGHYHSSRMDLFIPEVCQLADGNVNFAQYDANEDGYVDLVYVIFAGFGEQQTGADPDVIWPQSGTPYTYPSGSSVDEFCICDEKKVYRYGVHSELNFNPAVMEDNSALFPNGEPWINGIGLFCHEFSHCMGLPDFYPTIKKVQEAGNPAMEYWDLMDGGEYSNSGYNPTAYTAWEREYMGWMEMGVLKDEMRGKQISLVSIDKSSDGTAYKIFPDDNENGNEYVFIQNIQPAGWNNWLANKRGQGMLVTYVNYDSYAFSLRSNSVNNIVGESRMTIVPADGEYISSYLVGEDKDYSQEEYIASHKGDPFPGTKNVHELLSIPMIGSGKHMEKPLLNIQEENGVITFYYLTDSTVPQIATDIQQTDIDSNTKETKIYTLDGRYVGKSTRGLAKGVYIINGKKTVIR